MRKTKAMARAAVASLATAALASVSLGGTAFAWGDEDKDHGNTETTTCTSGGINRGTINANTAGATIANVLGPISALNGSANGNSVLSPNFC
jgi:hypothetical protein